MKKHKTILKSKRSRAQGKKAVFLLMTPENFLLKNWTALLKGSFSDAEIFAVVLDAKGQNFEQALNNALENSFKAVTFLRMGEIPSKLTKRLPEILDACRRNYLHVDFTYGSFPVPEKSALTIAKRAAARSKNKHDDQQ